MYCLIPVVRKDVGGKNRTKGPGEGGDEARGTVNADRNQATKARQRAGNAKGLRSVRNGFRISVEVKSHLEEDALKKGNLVG